MKECTLKNSNKNNEEVKKYAVKIVKFSDTEQLFNVKYFVCRAY